MFRALLTVVWIVTAGLSAGAGLEYYLTPLQERPFTAGHHLFPSSSLVGHSFGVVGAAFMIFGVLLYSTRRRVPALGKVGKLKHWLQFQIFLCTLGPFLILLHSTFRFSGLVAISFWSMALVVASGVFGRYLYVRIPKTLQGTFLSMEEVEAQLQSSSAGCELTGAHSQADFRACHTEMKWQDPSDFDYAQVSFPLRGRHVSVECVGCHVPEQLPSGSESIRYTPVKASDCSACHEVGEGEDQGSTFRFKDPGSCKACHQLDDPHSVPSSDCHKREQGPNGQSLVRYRPLEQTCTACHGGSV